MGLRQCWSWSGRADLHLAYAGAVSELDWIDKDAMKAALLTPEEVSPTASRADRGVAADSILLRHLQHCQYKFLGHVEGWAYSGRLKYLQQCRSVVVVRPSPPSLLIAKAPS